MKTAFRMLVTAVVVLGISCGRNKGGQEKELDSSFSGTIHISVDESFAPIIQEEINAYQAARPGTTIIPHFKPEADCMNDLLNDSARVVIVARKLNAEEEALLKLQNLSPEQLALAKDGISLIVQADNPVSRITLDQVLKIMRGEIKTWNQVDPEGSSEPVQLVFDNAGSSSIRYFAEMVNAKKLSANVFAMKQNAEVLDYVKVHPSALGVIGVNWISNRQDSTVQRFLKTVKVLEVAPADTSKFQGSFSAPYQLYLATGEYPLTRQVYVINREARMGLGTGFVNYMLGQQGQLILLRAGLVPVHAPVRSIEMKTTDEYQQ